LPRQPFFYARKPVTSSRTTCYYERKSVDDSEMIDTLMGLAKRYPRYGFYKLLSFEYDAASMEKSPTA